MKIPSSLTILLLFPLLTNAYTWQFTSQPVQCQNLSLSIQGSGQPPYSLLLLPTGPTPLQKTTEFRKTHNIPFSGTSVSFMLDYPANSTFVAMVSDKSGFGTGGTSNQITVLPSSDSGCYNTAQSGQVAWYYYTFPTGLPQCQSTQLFWDPLTVNGTVSFYGAILGGTSFVVPQGSLYSINNPVLGPNVNGVGFNWTVNIASGTQFFLIGNDDRGTASGGGVLFQVQNAENNNCLNNNSPSSTVGIAPGSSTGNSSVIPTSTGSSSGGPHSSSNSGKIIGAVSGGVILGSILLFALWFILSKRPVEEDYEDGVNWPSLQPFIPTNSTTEDVQNPQIPMVKTTVTTARVTYHQVPS